MKDYKKYIVEKLNEVANEICGEIMDKEGVTSGDIFPHQEFTLQANYESIAEIILEVVEQNKE